MIAATTRLHRLLLMTGTAVLIVGCGERGPTRYPISGSVTYGGKPVAGGWIRFEPALGNSGPAGFALIRDGRYDTRKDGRGFSGGDQRVVIYGTSGEPPPDSELVFGTPLFGEYVVEVELPDSEATYDFAVPRE